MILVNEDENLFLAIHEVRPYGGWATVQRQL